jgi:hypothetical protein
LTIVSIADFSIPDLAELLGLPLSHERIVTFLGRDVFKVRRDAYYGFIERRSEGVDIVFQEAPWVLPADQIVDEKALHLAAFHFHREGHEEYAGYAGPLPNGIAFDDSESELRHKLGGPFATGGGGFTTMPKLPIPRWLKYPVGDKILHLQVDSEGRFEMATLMTPDVRSNAR